MADVITVGLLYFRMVTLPLTLNPLLLGAKRPLLFRSELDDLFCAVGQLLETLGIHCP
jgi:hypothetical protein